MKKTKTILSYEEQMRLGRRMRARDILAKERLIRSSLGLMIDMAEKFSERGTPMTELIREGTRQLVQSSQRFDPDGEHPFSTYAAWWIKYGMAQLVASQRN